MLYLFKSKLQTVAQTPENTEDNVLIQFIKHCFYILKELYKFPHSHIFKNLQPLLYLPAVHSYVCPQKCFSLSHTRTCIYRHK